VTDFPIARIAGASWWSRFTARLRWRMTDHTDCLSRPDVDEMIRAARNQEIVAAHEVVGDRDRQIAILLAQLRELGIEPIKLDVIRRPLSTLIPGAGMRSPR